MATGRDGKLATLMDDAKREVFTIIEVLALR